MSENSGVHHFGCAIDRNLIDVVFSFLPVQPICIIIVVIETKRNKLGYDHPTVNNNPEVECAQAHQVSINTENVHQRQRKK
ncbi:hypothetical protein SDC9_86759 [bioreactor metagenome]|uniref:Uncharacterized protein n=1 Tax=bioreactor metagenome TaxID=1076179 RepID=A0A644ZJU3_9ZZZZ